MIIPNHKSITICMHAKTLSKLKFKKLTFLFHTQAKCILIF